MLFIAYVRYFFAYLKAISSRYVSGTGSGVGCGRSLVVWSFVVAVRTGPRGGLRKVHLARVMHLSTEKNKKGLDNLAYTMYLIYKMTNRFGGIL